MNSRIKVSVKNNILVCLVWLLWILIFFDAIPKKILDVFGSPIVYSMLPTILISYFLSISKLPLTKNLLYFLKHTFFLIIFFLLFVFVGFLCYNCYIKIYPPTVTTAMILFVGSLVTYFGVIFSILKILRKYNILCSLIWYGNNGALLFFYLMLALCRSH
ncbi:MAG: hypothetical protein LBH05_05305 [Deferribacteraceae bacterium]|jgi:hypothetical protein|nr:hypothetical protein [Deferribacteraceae bacterium]